MKQTVFLRKGGGGHPGIGVVPEITFPNKIQNCSRMLMQYPHALQGTGFEGRSLPSATLLLPLFLLLSPDPIVHLLPLGVVLRAFRQDVIGY